MDIYGIQFVIPASTNLYMCAIFKSVILIYGSSSQLLNTLIPNHVDLYAFHIVSMCVCVFVLKQTLQLIIIDFYGLPIAQKNDD